MKALGYGDPKYKKYMTEQDFPELILHMMKYSYNPKQILKFMD
jgi:hypothetical protein